MDKAGLGRAVLRLSRNPRIDPDPVRYRYTWQNPCVIPSLSVNLK